MKLKFAVEETGLNSARFIRCCRLRRPYFSLLKYSQQLYNCDLAGSWGAMERPVSVTYREREAQCVSTSDYQKLCVYVCEFLSGSFMGNGADHWELPPPPIFFQPILLSLPFQNVTWQTCDFGMLYHPLPLPPHTPYRGNLGYFVFRGRHWLEEGAEVGGTTGLERPHWAGGGVVLKTIHLYR